MSELPLMYLWKQINDDYYKYHKSLKEVLRKYDRYPEEEIFRVLGIYDLSKEPIMSNATRWFTAEMRKEWNDTCRRINPKAWSGRK